MKHIARTRKFVQDHKVAIAVVTTATVLMTLQYRNTKVLNEYLREHDLFDDYYTPEDE